MKVGKFLVALVFSLIFLSGNCFAGNYSEEYLDTLKEKNPSLYLSLTEDINVTKADPNLLDDMKYNSQDYIEVGTLWGFNNAFVAEKYYICKPSLKVLQYEPPKYIISVKQVRYIPEDMSMEMAYWSGTRKFLYDYNEQKIYVLSIDSTPKLYWKYLDTKFANSRNESRSNDLEAAEFAFYFAYKQSFFKKPVSKSFKNYLKKGTLKTFTYK